MKTNDTVDYLRVLVIDDNESIHRDFRKILGSETGADDVLDELDAALFGTTSCPVCQRPVFDLQHASQGEEGLQMLRQAVSEKRPFGTAFVDMRMPPGWDGVETIRHLWEADPHLQVVICTAFSDHSWDEIAEQLGMTDKLLVLKKPFDQIEVIQLATSLCEKRRLLEQASRTLDRLTSVVDEQALALKAAHDNAETLLESLTTALISLDTEGRVARWNSAAAELFGISEKQASGCSFTDLAISWEEPDAVSSLMANAVPEESTRHELQFCDDAGGRRTVALRVCPIQNDSSSGSRLILADDITEQKLMQSQLDQAQRLESVGQLAAGVAHEINTPMQYIGDNVRFVSKTLQRLKQPLDVLPIIVDESVGDEEAAAARREVVGCMKPAKVRSSLEQISEALADSVEGVEAVSRIVAAMKEFSHPGGGEKTHVCLNHILESTITVARNEWKYVADVLTDLDPQMPTIPAFGSELNQAFLNIIVNAAHAIADRVAKGDFEKGVIQVRTELSDDRAVVTIRDTGGGIPASVRDRVFDPFFTTKEVGKGTGQGLAIARSVIVNKHGGSLSFDVEEGEATTFRIELPTAELPEAADDCSTAEIHHTPEREKELV